MKRTCKLPCCLELRVSEGAKQPHSMQFWPNGSYVGTIGTKLSIFKGVRPDSIYMDAKVVRREPLSALSIYDIPTTLRVRIRDWGLQGVHACCFRLGSFAAQNGRLLRVALII